jgi:acetyl-CoA synthetase
MIRGLWNEPERFVREYFDRIPGCYCTYDLAVKDNDGHFWVIGRSDDVINVAGHRLSTMEIESAITGCDGVTEAAVIGMPDELKGATPVAFVILRNDAGSSGEMRNKIRQRIEFVIGKIAVPSLICFTEVLPKTTSGKTMRRLLREILTTGTVCSDTTGIEDAGALEKVKDALSREILTSNNPSSVRMNQV